MKESIKNKNLLKKRRIIRSRAKLFGTAEKPRLAVFRSLRHISLQAIDDKNGNTLVSVSDKGLKGTKIEKAKEVGKQTAVKLLEKNIDQAIFDKRSYKYHGVVKEIAESARQAGLKF